MSREPLRYLALGDSYTAGTGASNASHSWPAIIADRLEGGSGRPVELTNPAVNGYTTLDLIQHELTYLRRTKPDFVTILIGVNDLVRGWKKDRYRQFLVRIYGEVARLNLPGGHVAAVSIPNWSYVPAADGYGGRDHVGKLTEDFNEIAAEEAKARGFTWIDIGAASTSGIGSEGWIAADNLHPGDAQYGAWADAVWSTIGEVWVRP